MHPMPIVKAGTVLFFTALLAAGTTVVIAASPGGGLPRRSGAGSAEKFKVLSPAARRQVLKPSVSLGRTGAPAAERTKPFSAERALGSAERVERLLGSGAPVADWHALQRALGKAASVRSGIARYESGSLAREDEQSLARQAKELENLEGIALKGARRAAAYHPPQLAPLPEGFQAGALRERARPEAGTTKTNTGWILDQHVFDPASTETFTTLNSDYRLYDEGQNDITMGHSDHPGPGAMFGWVWQVQSFYWTDTAVVSDHATPSYCLFVMVSSDGGFTWQLYSILYDPTGAGHTTSMDMINPKLAMDVTGTYDRYFIAYEYCASPTDHDVYVYSETSELDGGTANPQDVGVGVTTSMERNPAITSDYKTGETSYRVVAYEYAYSATDYDLYASQSTGDGSTWTAPLAVAETTGMETHPALSAGCSGVTNDAFVHLAYNYDTYTTGSTQILLNPGFESGDNGDWTVRVTGDISGSGTNTHTGTYKAWLGGTLDQPNDWIYQQVAIPVGAPTAQFSFWLKIVSAETVVTPHDVFNAEVRDASGNLIEMLVTLSDADKTTYASYAQLSYDLSKYRGQTIRVHFWCSNDAANTTSFYVDDAALSVGSYNTASEVRYQAASHPGATPYPDGLAASSPRTVLPNTGNTTAWPYGPPAIAASHGGGASVPGGRLIVVADQLFPADQPNPGDSSRYQLIYAMNMCNGGDACGDITGCSPALSLNWNAYYFDDVGADYRYPSLVVDGVGWVEGTSGVPQNGVRDWPEIFIAYYYREIDSPSDFGSAQMLLADASDETCTGFASGAWYLMTASPEASDDDDRVVAKQGTIAAFNYFYGWPGVCFNKRYNHFGATVNDDVYFTTLGDNYVIDTLSAGSHINAYWTFYGTSYFGPWTYPWPAGFQMTVTADERAEDNGLSYAFSAWSTGDKTLALTVLTDYCGYSGSCPTTSINALYDEVGATPLRVPYGITPMRAETDNQGADLTVTWDAATCPSANYHLLYGKGEGLPSWTVDGGVCTLGVSGASVWAGAPDPSGYTSRFLWFLVVGDDGANTEGSWGATYPDGAEEGGAAPSNQCGMVAKDLSGTCGAP